MNSAISHQAEVPGGVLESGELGVCGAQSRLNLARRPWWGRRVAGAPAQIPTDAIHAPVRPRARLRWSEGSVV